VHFDKEGRRTGYWLYDQNPYDTFQSTSKFVPVDEVIHLYNVERPGQVRGVPWGASAIIRLRNFDEYEDAQLVRQKIAACFSVFVQDSTHAESGVIGGSDTDMLEKVEPGIIEHVPPGKQVVFGNPPGVEGYNEYSTKTLQAVAAGYGVTYEALTGDLSGVNFSSGRMGWLEFYRNVVHAQQHIMIPQMCDRSFDWFLLGLELKGTSYGPLNQSWTPPRREMIDPVKETKAMVLAIRNGLMSYAEAVRQFGGDPDLLLDEIKKYQDKFDDMEITLDSDPRRPNPEGATNNREPSEPNE
jgi:lambda family phage portal protein